MKNSNKGITLLALIITIIVMLILAGISISMLFGEEGIINRAQEAGEEQRGATVEEHRDLWKDSINIENYGTSEKAQELEELLEDLKEGNLINQQEKDFILENGYIKIGSRTIVFSGKVLEIGDYVNYQPTIVEGIYEYAGENYTGSTNNTELKQDRTLKWRVLNINNDTVDLISNTQTNIGIYYKGIIGVNNSVAILNNYCYTMYSNEQIGAVARSLNLEDIQKKVKVNEDGKKGYEIEERYDAHQVEYGKTCRYTVHNLKYPLKFLEDDGLNTISEPKFPTEADLINITNDSYISKTGEIEIMNKYCDIRTEDFENEIIKEILCGDSGVAQQIYLATRGILVMKENYGRTINFGTHILNAYSSGEINTTIVPSEIGEIYRSVRPVVSIPRNRINFEEVYDENIGWILE